MKSLLYLFFCFTALTTSAQKHVIKTNPLTPFFGGFDLEYNNVVSPKISMVGYFAYQTASSTTSTTKTDVSVGVIEGGANFGIQSYKDNPRGWYISPRVGIGSFTASNNYNQSARGSVLSLVALLGHQWVMSKSEQGVVLDIYGGVNYMDFFDIRGDVSASNFKAVAPRINIMLGYAF